MIKQLFVFFSIIISFVPTFGQQKSIADPVYLGLLLIDEISADKMAETCRYYGLEEEAGQNGFRVFKFMDGTFFEFKSEIDGDRRYPVVRMTTNIDLKKVQRILNDAGYKKDGSNYVKGSKFELRQTRCIVTSRDKSSKYGRKTLTFTKEYNSI